MKRTAYAVATDEELTTLAQTRPGASEMEIELAQRLVLALDKIEDLEDTSSGLDIHSKHSV